MIIPKGLLEGFLPLNLTSTPSYYSPSMMKVR
jgi:hypothetical protein